MKTTEQAAEELIKIEIFDGNDNDSMFSSRLGMKMIYKRVFKSGVEFAQRWIPVEEELPNVASDSENRWNNTHGFSLPVITKNDEFMPTYYKIQSYNVELKAWQTSEKVTHWRPIERN